MKSNLKTLPVVLLLTIVLGNACKKGPSGTADTKTVVPPPPIETTKAYLPTQVGTGKNKMAFSYTADHCFRKIEYGDGTSDVFSYTATGNPARIQHFQGTIEVYTVEFVVDKNGALTEAYQYTYTIPDNEEAAGYYLLSYSSSKEPSTISYYDSSDVLLSSQQQTYSSAGNLSSKVSSSQSLSREYVYDDKNGLFKNVKFSWLSALENQNNLFLSRSNNLKTSKNTSTASDEQVFSYTYNSSQYPTTIVSTKAGTSTSLQVTYQEIE